MSKTNLVPLAKVRKWPSILTQQQQSTSDISLSIPEEKRHFDIKKESLTNDLAYTDCGNFGQNNNPIQKDPNQKDVDISSNTSDEYQKLLAYKTNNNSLPGMGKKVPNISPSDSCISLESQMECFQGRIQRLEFAHELLSREVDKQNPSKQVSTLAGSLNKFVKTKDLEKHPFIQQMQEKIKSLTEKNNDQKIMLEQSNNFQQLFLTFINENKTKNNSEMKNVSFGVDHQIREELEILRSENKLLREKNEEIGKNELELYKKLTEANEIISQFELEKTLIKQRFDQEIKNVQIEASKKITKLKSICYQNNNLALKKRKLTNELVQNGVTMSFVKITNKLGKINDQYTCCENKCINSNFVNGFCLSKNGYINLNKDGNDVKYHIVEQGKNKWIQLNALCKYTKACSYLKKYSLYYFEVTMIKETDKICYAGIGLCGTNANIFLCNNSNNWLEYQKFSWEDNDVFGYGLVYPPRKDLHAKPYTFFTKNGTKIGVEILLNEKDDVLCPFIGLLSCSVKINFGNNLKEKPFCYNISSNI